MLKQLISLQNYSPILFWDKLERLDPCIDVFVVVVTNIISIYVIYWYLFVLSNQIKMSRLIKENIDIETKVLKVLALNMEPTLDPPNANNIPNTIDIKGLYNIPLLSRIHYFPKGCQDIRFIINGQCCVLIEIISSLETWFDAITPLSERDKVFEVQVEFIEGIYARFSGKLLDIMKTHIDLALRIQDDSCCRY